MRITFGRVDTLPPKKDGANSMWNKGSERARLKALRLAAYEAMQGNTLLSGPLSLTLTVYAFPEEGDLDNFITGICDGLMAAHPMTPIAARDWDDLPDGAMPERAIVYRDDASICQIVARREVPVRGRRSYEVTIQRVETDRQ